MRGPNPLASICGRVCGAPCEAACRRGKVPRVDDDGRFVAQDRPIAIRALKRFACDQFGPESRPTADGSAGRETLRARRCRPMPTRWRLCCGPSCAGNVDPASGRARGHHRRGTGGTLCRARSGADGLPTVVFESEPVPAGMFALGVPAYRLPRELIAREVAVIEALGVEIRCGVDVGRDISLADIRGGFCRRGCRCGCQVVARIGTARRARSAVYGGVDLLRAVALGSSLDVGREVVVIGGGNVAYDVARSVLRQIAYDTARTAARLAGAGHVHLVSLETLEEMPADTLEIFEGDEEGIARLQRVGPSGYRAGLERRGARGYVPAVPRVYDEQPVSRRSLTMPYVARSPATPSCCRWGKRRPCVPGRRRRGYRASASGLA